MNKKGKTEEELFNELLSKMKQLFEEYPEMVEEARGELANVDDRLGKENPITVDDWRATHPYRLSCGSDRFYASLANELLNKFAVMPLAPNLPEGFLRMSAMSVAAYLEDLITGLHVWDSLRKLHTQKYGTLLPFYDCGHSEYYVDDINVEDLRLLIWQSMCRCGQADERIFSPMSPAVIFMADEAFDILVDNFGKAPEAMRLKKELEKVFKEGDFYALRTVSLWLCFDNPITAVPGWHEDVIEEAKSIMDSNIDIDPSMALYVCEVALSFMDHVSFMGCPAQQLLAEVVQCFGYNKTADLVGDIKKHSAEWFAIEKYDQNVITVKSKTDETFEVDRTSFGSKLNLKNIKTAMLSLVKYGELWQQNGLSSFSEMTLEQIDSKKTILSDPPESMLEHFRELVKKNRGRRVFYFGSLKEVQDFVGVATPQPMDGSDGNDATNFVLMLNDNDLPTLIADMAGIFSDPANPFYDKDMSRDEMGNQSLGFICQGCMSDEVAEYVQEKNLLPHAFMYASQGKMFGKRLVKDNLRFLNNFYTVEIPEVD